MDSQPPDTTPEQAEEQTLRQRVAEAMLALPDYWLLEPVMTFSQCFGLLCLAMMKKDERANVDYTLFFGVEDIAKLCITDPVDGLKLVLQRGAGITGWDGKTSILNFGVKEAGERGKSNRAFAEWALEKNRRDEAYKILKSWRNNGAPSRAAADRAAEILGIPMTAKPPAQEPNLPAQ